MRRRTASHTIDLDGYYIEDDPEEGPDGFIVEAEGALVRIESPSPHVVTIYPKEALRLGYALIDVALGCMKQ